MPPNSSGAPKPLLNLSMRRGVPPSAGSTTPLALHRSEFEDFMNAYRPSLDAARREPEHSKPAEESKVDFGRSIKKLMKKPQNSPSVIKKNHRKEGIQRTPTVAPGSSSRLERERSVASDVRPVTEKKPKRPVSAHLEVTPLTDYGPAIMPPDITIPKLEIPPTSAPLILPKNPSAPVASPKNPPAPVASPKNPPAPVVSPKNSSAPVVPPKNPKAVPKISKAKQEDQLKVISDSAPVLPVAPSIVPAPNLNQVKKKVSIQEEKRRSGTETFPDAHCLIISGNNIGRFIPPRHNPDPILSMRVVPIPERKYHVILEFQEMARAPRPHSSTSGLLVFEPEESNSTTFREQIHYFSWIRESHIATMGMLLQNVEKITDFPYVTYVVVTGGRHELAQKLHVVQDRPTPEETQQLHFLAGYEEAITIARPPLATFPEKPTSDKTGFVICLYQVLPGDDSSKFEHHWMVWTGARQIYRTIPEYMGLKRISVHKSVLPTKIINYCLICEFSNIMEYLTEACVIIDHLRARCCGFTGIYRVLDTL
ncbi:titin-like [Stegodyphus dumicola]|uniref:titin-like n=1 Tax=Stegodyphus dumicola TaxID=202533 RepID=UPI0015AB1D7E|nr:titin-like [Stegodyphus dumicola]